MFALIRKEVNSFMASVTGYVVLTVFLSLTGLFIWVLRDTGFNLLQTGYANLDSLFILAPWLFMFLIPAITMRSFSEEKRNGTIELLLTKPFTELQVVSAKFLAAVVLVLIALLPTFIYLVTVYFIAAPQGNIDLGGIAGSYMGLFFLSCTFCAIGIFASILSPNQVVAFIIALLFCFLMHTGFEYLSHASNIQSMNNILAYAGIESHYASISRGVIDSRDVIYFLSASALFLFLSKFILEKRKW